jgi:probable HAF family extracellular repeat protein
MIAFTSLIALGAPAFAAVEYQFVPVLPFQPDYDLSESYIYDLDDGGRATGLATDLPSYSGFWWTNATDKVRVSISYPHGINNLGTIVGADRYLLAGGAAIVLPRIPGVGGPILAMAVNDAGVVVGYEETCSCSNSAHTLQVPYIWDAAGGVRTLNLANAKEILRVNASGVAVGNTRHYLGNDGFVVDLNTGSTVVLGTLLPPPVGSTPWTMAADINDAGVVAGERRTDDATTMRGFTWSAAGGFKFLPGLATGQGRNVHPSGINAAGQVVGSAVVDADGNAHAFIWDAAHGTRDLNALATLPPGFILDNAVRINDQGAISGQGHFGPTWGPSKAFVLAPVGTLGVPRGEDTRLALSVTPNPAHGVVGVQFTLPAAATARLQALDIAGRAVATLHEGPAGPGTTNLSWIARTADGRSVSPGLYFLRLETRYGVVSRSLVLIR